MTVVVALAGALLTFLATVVALTSHRRALVRDRISPYVAAGHPKRAARPTPSMLGAQMDRLLRRYGAYARLQLALDRAGADVSVGTFSALWAGAAVAVCVLLTMLGGPGAGVFGVVLTAVGPWALLRVRAGRRRRAFDAQLPEILDTFASSLRAGHGFEQALRTMAADVAEPAGSEFRRALDEVQLGRPLDDALFDLGTRLQSGDFRFMLDAIAVQRQVGGSLAGLFDLVAETVRSREQFRRKLRALTGMVRTSANVLTALPFATALLLTLVNHSYMSPLWTTPAGFVLVGVAGTMIAVGSLVIRRVGSVNG